MTQAELERLKELEAKATKGEWSSCGMLPANGEAHICSEADTVDHEILGMYISHNNAAFIAAARNALPELIKEIEQLRNAMAAQDDRERKAGEKCAEFVEAHGCDWPDAMADLVTSLREKAIQQHVEIERLTEENGELKQRKELDDFANELAEKRVDVLEKALREIQAEVFDEDCEHALKCTDIARKALEAK